MTSKFQRAIPEKSADVNEEVIRQQPVRSPVREEDPRARAAARAAKIRDHIGGMDEGTDEFYKPASPDGWTYEWKRHKIWNQEDPSYTVQLRREGWDPVPLHRDAEHEAMMPSNWEGNTIERKGMILMERPKEISDEVHRIDQRRARDQVRTKEAQLAGTPDGTLDRVKPSIKKSFDMPIPEDL